MKFTFTSRFLHRLEPVKVETISGGKSGPFRFDAKRHAVQLNRSHLLVFRALAGRNRNDLGTLAGGAVVSFAWENDGLQSFFTEAFCSQDFQSLAHATDLFVRSMNVTFPPEAPA